MAEQPYDVRVAVAETRLDAHEQLIARLTQDMRDSRALYQDLDAKVGALDRRVSDGFSALHGVVRDGIAVVASMVPPRVAWVMAVVVGVLGVVIGAVGALHR